MKRKKHTIVSDVMTALCQIGKIKRCTTLTFHAKTKAVLAFRSNVARAGIVIVGYTFGCSFNWDLTLQFFSGQIKKLIYLFLTNGTLHPNN